MVGNETSQAINNLLKEHADLAGVLLLCAGTLQTYLSISEVEDKPPPRILLSAYKQAIEVLAQYDFIEPGNWKTFDGPR